MKKLIYIFIPCVLIAICLALHLTQVSLPGEDGGANAEEAANESDLEPDSDLEPYAYLFDLAPDLEGLIKEIDTGEDGPRLVYIASKDNPYSLPIGAYAGELRTGIVINDREACAVALVPEVAGSIKNKQKDGESKLIIPLDIKGGGSLPLRISTVSRSANDLSSLLISFSGYMELINTIQDASGFVLSSNSMSLPIVHNDASLTLENYRILVPELPESSEEGLFAVYISDDLQYTETDTSGMEFGSPFNIAVPSPVLISSPKPPLTEEKLIILKNSSGGDVLVFVTAASEIKEE